MNERRYVVALFDPYDQQPRYVGKTRNPELFHLHPSRWAYSASNPEKNLWVRGLLARGTRPAVVVLEDTTVRRAPRLQRMWLDRYRKWGCPILNIDKAPKNREASLQLWRTQGFWEKVHQGWERRRAKMTFDRMRALAALPPIPNESPIPT